jgi:hypothetical protein
VFLATWASAASKANPDSTEIVINAVGQGALHLLGALLALVDEQEIRQEEPENAQGDSPEEHLEGRPAGDHKEGPRKAGKDHCSQGLRRQDAFEVPSGGVSRSCDPQVRVGGPLRTHESPGQLGSPCLSRLDDPCVEWPVVHPTHFVRDGSTDGLYGCEGCGDLRSLLEHRPSQNDEGSEPDE